MSKTTQIGSTYVNFDKVVTARIDKAGITLPEYSLLIINESIELIVEMNQNELHQLVNGWMSKE